MPQNLTCRWCGNVTPLVDFAKELQYVEGEPVAVCRWCATGESRPSQASIDTADTEMSQTLRAESRDSDRAL